MAEHRIVAPKVMGSSPIGHPNSLNPGLSCKCSDGIYRAGVQMDTLMDKPGDSGAPFFLDNQGIGIGIGACQSLTTFSKLTFADDALGSRYVVMLN